MYLLLYFRFISFDKNILIVIKYVIVLVNSNNTNANPNSLKYIKFSMFTNRWRH